MKHVYTFLVFLSCYLGNALAQTGNVGVGTSSPNSSSILDITSSNKGLLVPRVALTGTTDASTISSPATSLLVYNTATTGTAPYNVTPGYYYNAGTTTSPNWVRLQTKGDNDWTVATTTSTPAIKTDNQYVTGKAGIGDFSSTTPQKAMHIKHTSNSDGLLLQNNTGGAGSTTNILFSTYSDIGGVNRPGASIKAVDGGGYSADLIFSTKVPGADANSLTEKVLFKSNGNVQVNDLAGTGNRPVSADANGVLIIGNKLRETTVHDFYLPDYKSCGGCDKFMWFPRPGGSSGDDEDDNPLYERNMWIAPYSGRIVSITLAVDPTSSNSGVEISNGRFVFEHDNTLSESGVSYYTNMSNGTYTNTSLWNGGEYTTVYGSPSYTISSPNRGRFSVNESQKIRWDSKGSTLFSFTKGQTLALGLSANYIEDNSYLITVVWEYDVDDY
ncbi:MAG: hypothetical protein R2739_10820 [Chitinophagales bacterium]|nr:hypothetical protein [Bacteroidota bacterium]